MNFLGLSFPVFRPNTVKYGAEKTPYTVTTYSLYQKKIWFTISKLKNKFQKAKGLKQFQTNKIFLKDTNKSCLEITDEKISPQTFTICTILGNIQGNNCKAVYS